MEKSNQKLQVWIAIFAIVLPIIVTLVLKLIEQKTKELSIYYTQTEKALINTTIIDNKINLSYDSIKVENISITKIIIENSGTSTLNQTDFEKGGIKLIITPEIEKNLDNTLPYLMDVVLSENAKQRNSKLTFDSNEKNGYIEYSPSLLNKGDKIVIETYIPMDTKIKLDYIGKIKGGTIKAPVLYSKVNKISKLETLINSINNFSTYKSITIFLFVILFSTMSLGAIGFQSMATNDSNEWSDMKLQSKIIFLLMVIMSLLFLFLLIISTII